MSDLQCAATVLVLAAGAAGDHAWAADRRVALVYADGSPGTTVPATRLAAELDVASRPAPAGSLTEALEDLADEHRGECVVLVAGDDAVADLARGLGAGAGPAVVVELDADGRRLSALPTGR